MNKQEKQESRRLPGFYIALCCCVIAVGIAGYFTERASNNGAGTSGGGASEIVSGEDAYQIADADGGTDTSGGAVSASVDADNVSDGGGLSDPTGQIYIEPKINAAAPDLPAAPEIPAAPDIPETEANSAEAASAPQTVGEDITDAEEAAEAAALFASPSFVLPASGDILEGFSETLSYNTALGDWRTHNGTDIAVDAGGSVCAAADGTISRISSDAMGEYVIIEHDGGFSSKYCSLSSVEDIAEGDTVKEGDVIGIVTNSRAENVTDTHVHFELYKDGEVVDPMKYTG